MTILEKSNAILTEKNSKILAGNIKSGVTIFDVTGTVVELNGETKTVSPTTSQQVITPTSGKNAITQVTVEAVDNTIDANIIAGNIKNNVTILGVTGTYVGDTAPSVQYIQDTSNIKYNNAVSYQDWTPIVDTTDPTYELPGMYFKPIYIRTESTGNSSVVCAVLITSDFSGTMPSAQYVTGNMWFPYSGETTPAWSLTCYIYHSSAGYMALIETGMITTDLSDRTVIPRITTDASDWGYTVPVVS